MRKLPPLLVILLTMACAGRSETDWLAHPTWDKGLAQVSLYDGKDRKYGELRDSTLELITVREYFDPVKLVKTRPAQGKPVLDIMKLNITRRTRTGIYEYVQMASVFVDRKSGQLVKLSAVSSEWCGNSFALYTRRKSGASLQISSYMDDAGLSTRKLSQEPPLFYDQLLLHFRQNLDTLEPGQTFSMSASLITNKPAYKKITGRISAVRNGRITAAGKQHKVRIIEIDAGGVREIFAFSRDPLHTLIEWKRPATQEYYRLRKTMFLDYWNRFKPGDEKLLK